MKKTPPKKPTGAMGPLKLGDQGAEFQQIEFPRNKEEIEEFIVKSFVNSCELMPIKITRFQHNSQNDFDYSVQTTDGDKYLELMEVAPLEHLGTYEKAPSHYNLYDFSEYIFKKILGKSQKYKGVKKTKICLLVYITHWSFTPSINGEKLLQYWAATQEHGFEYIFFYLPFAPTFGVSKLIYPIASELLDGFDPELLRGADVAHASPKNVTGNTWTLKS